MVIKQTKHLYNVRYKVYKVTISHQSADLVGSPLYVSICAQVSNPPR